MRAKSTPTLSGWPNQSCQLLLHHSPLYISSLFSFLLSEFFSAYSGLSSPSLLPWRWIYKTSGQRPSLCTGLDQIYFLFSALCFERRVRARERISRKTLVVQGYLGWRGLGNSLQDMSFFLLFLNKSVFSTGVKAEHKKSDNISPRPCDSCKTANGNGKRAAQNKLFKQLFK